MKQTDILTGRIIQRVLDKAKKEVISEVSVIHGVNDHHNIERLINNLFEYFPDSTIALQKLKFGYELKITVRL